MNRRSLLGRIGAVIGAALSGVFGAKATSAADAVTEPSLLPSAEIYRSKWLEAEEKLKRRNPTDSTFWDQLAPSEKMRVQVFVEEYREMQEALQRAFSHPGNWSPPPGGTATIDRWTKLSELYEPGLDLMQIFVTGDKMAFCPEYSVPKPTRRMSSEQADDLYARLELGMMRQMLHGDIDAWDGKDIGQLMYAVYETTHPYGSQIDLDRERLHIAIEEWDGKPDAELGERLREYVDPESE